ncbi:AraC family transcriptional regulator [Paenibacillus sp. GCM10023252]|uniref:helix-turn-helix transcriptional regulator n=1 Tax=Paenibacillus sp. GCM10023252 TaxID=3252649 RepID=UPI00360BE299
MHSSLYAWEQLQIQVSYANCLSCGAGQTFGPRIIKDYQFIFVARGTGSAVIQQQVYQASAGDLFYYGPEVVHTFSADEQDPFVLYGVHFSWQSAELTPASLSDLSILPVQADASIPSIDNRCRLGGDASHPDTLQLTDRQMVSPALFEPRFARLVEAYQANHAYTPTLLRSLFTELLIAMKRAEQLPHLSPDIAHPIVSLIASKLEQQAAERYRRSWLSEWTSYHPDYAAKLFRASTGRTPYDYFMNRKLELVKHLLIQTDETLLAIAEQVHGGSIHAFTRWFKEMTGIPPARYRHRSRML